MAALKSKPTFEIAIWLSSATIAILIAGMLWFVGLVISIGLSSLWPKDVVQYEWFDIDNEEWIISAGQSWEQEELLAVRSQEYLEQYQDFGPASLQTQNLETFKLLTIKTGNRKLYGQAYLGIPDFAIRSISKPKEVAVIERKEWGDFIGYIKAIEMNSRTVADNLAGINEILANEWPKIRERSEEIEDLKFDTMGAINQELADIQTQLKQKDLDAEQRAKLRLELEHLRMEHTIVTSQINSLQALNDVWNIRLVTLDDEETTLELESVYSFYYPNQMTVLDKVGLFLKGFLRFIIENPRESNSEGGIAPAIFGTIVLVFIMTIIVMPLGVITAIYMHEYSNNGIVISFVRILVNNLAGVPSIVFGIFGLGFFVYNFGSILDAVFYAQALPSPTFGTPGLLWSSLTLALLTLPVVIVSTEEGLARIPRAVREGGLALGATKWETTKLLVVPMASPAILTGVILAISRAAGEVAPLMLVGVVKLSNQMPIDGIYPFLHLERKFMHLGFHIYDLAFQSPDVESSIPTAYTTAFVLMILVFLLNIAAFMIRSRLRKKYKTIEI